MERNNAVWIGLLALLIGMLVGYWLGGMGKIAKEQGIAKEEQLLAKTLGEHAAITVPALKAELKQEPDLEALKQAVEVNNAAVADAVATIYPDAKNDFLLLWKKHLDYYKEYLMATKAGDTSGQALAKQNLANFAEEMSAFFAQRGTTDKEALRQAFATHGDHVVMIIDAMMAEDYDTVYKTAHQAHEHMVKIAQLLVHKNR